jgi:hypothetical protein
MPQLEFTDIPTPKLSRAEQARINGSKSLGPITSEGKLKCSRGALKHGLTATKHAVLDIEDSAQFQAALDAAVDQFRPDTLFTLRLVEKLAHLDWRLERLALLETAYLDYQINQESENPLPIAAEGNDEIAALVRVWINSTNGNPIDLLRRYITTLENQYNRTLRNILDMEQRSQARRRNPDFHPEFLPPYKKPEPPPSDPEPAPQPIPEQQPQPKPPELLNVIELKPDAKHSQRASSSPPKQQYNTR